MKNLKNLVKIQSYENKENIINFIKETLKNDVEEIIVVKNKEDNNSNLLIGVNTKLKNTCPIVLSGHIDTVNPEFEKYNTNPFELTEIDGKCYGLGAIDMKSFVAIIMDNINVIKNCTCPVVLSLTTDEETKFYGIKNIINKMKELNIKPKFSIIGEPTNFEICTTAKGGYAYKCEVFGVGCHSSKVNEGKNAISIIAKLITFIEEKQKKYADLTSNCAIISGGNIINRVPDYASLNFDVRTLQTDINDFISSIEQKILKLEKEYAPATIKLTKTFEILPLNNKNCALINKICNYLGVKMGNFTGGCEAGYFQNYFGQAIIFGVGDLCLAHKPNEYVVKSEYFNYSCLLIKLIKMLEAEQ